MQVHPHPKERLLLTAMDGKLLDREQSAIYVFVFALIVPADGRANQLVADLLLFRHLRHYFGLP